MAYAVSQVEQTGRQPIRSSRGACSAGDVLTTNLPLYCRSFSGTGTSSSAASRSAMNSSTACSTPAIASCIVGAHLDSHDNSTQRPTYSPCSDDHSARYV
jgi:hypothetical protein